MDEADVDRFAYFVAGKRLGWRMRCDADGKRWVMGRAECVDEWCIFRDNEFDEQSHIDRRHNDCVNRIDNKSSHDNYHHCDDNRSIDNYYHDNCDDDNNNDYGHKGNRNNDDYAAHHNLHAAHHNHYYHAGGC